MKFAVIGGDMRQAKLAELFAADRHIVSTFALDKLRLTGTYEAKSPDEAAAGADCVVLPLPAASGERMLNAPFSAAAHGLGHILDAIGPEQTVCAGRVDEWTDCEARSRGISVTDYFAREELAVSNAVATAEGAIQLIMEETPVTICGSECLVIGFGRIGKVLAHRLLALGARVTVSARKFADLAWIKAYGYDPAETGELTDILDRYDIVINTVPACVLNEARLRRLKPGCLCLDLASKPGGMDFQTASLLGIKAVWALGLPGEVAPVSSGAMIRDTIYNILREQGKYKCQK